MKDNLLLLSIPIVFIAYAGFSAYALFGVVQIPLERDPDALYYFAQILFDVLTVVGYLVLLIRMRFMNRIVPAWSLVCVLIMSVSIMSGLVMSFARVYLQLGFQCGALEQHDANSAFYLSAITWTNLGYSDCVPGANARFFAGYEALLGFVFLSIFIGYFVDLFSEFAQHSGSE